MTALAPARPNDLFTALEEGNGAGEPLWAEQRLLGVDPEAMPGAALEKDLDPAVGQDCALDRIEAARDRIVALLGPSPITLDDLGRAAEASAREVRIALVELDLAGRLEFSGGDRVALRPFANEAR